MARDPFLVLRAVRQRAVEQARQSLAACLKAEADAIGVVDALAEASRLDRSAEEGMDEAPQFLQMFANRLVALRAQRGAAAAQLVSVQAKVSQVREEVATARAHAEALDQLIAEKSTVRLAELDRKAQHAMDDIARAAHAVRRGGKV